MYFTGAFKKLLLSPCFI